MRKLSLLLVLLLLTAAQLLAQRNIVGIVTGSDDGVGIPGVTVLLKGTSNGVLTDVEGKYTISVPKDATGQVLQYSYVGMKTVEVTITALDYYDVVMKSEAAVIEGVVVTAFGINRQAKELGYATATVGGKDLTRAGSTNMVNSLNAKVSGLQINTVNNGVNPDTRITLRGNRHFLASNQALVVLDGVPVSATYLNTINPNDIGSVTVLKGASASALYGNEASNGVLIVTTKKGGTKPEIKVSNTTTFEKVSYMPDLQTRFGSGSGETPANNIGGDVPDYTFWIGPDRNTDPYTSYENQSYGPEFNGQQVILGGVLADGTYQTVPYSAVKNQKKDFFQTGTTIQNDVSYSQGNDKGNFYLSAQNVRTQGTIPDDENHRTTLRAAGGQTYGMFTAQFNVGYTKTKTDVSGGEFFQGRPVYWNVLNTPAQVPLTSYKDIVNNKFANNNGYFNAYYPNPYWQLSNSRQQTDVQDILGNIFLSLKPADWIELSFRGGLTSETYEYNSYRAEVTFNEYMTTDPWGAGHMAAGKPLFPGASSNSMSTSQILTGDFLVTLQKDITNWTSKLIIGTSGYKNQYESIGVGANSLVIPDFYNISNRVGEPSVGQNTSARNAIGVFGDLTLGYKDFLFVHASARNDWDSRLTENNRSFFYPGVDVSLVLSQLIPSIQANSSFLSFAKIRGGWAQVGQISLTNWYSTLPSYNAGSGFPYGGQAGFVLGTTLSNPDLKPEITSEYEVGFELGFIKNRINLQASAYQSLTSDQTIPAEISAATGYVSAYINAGELQTQGIETDLRITPVFDVAGFSWNLTFNYSYNTSKVISIQPGINELAIPQPDGTVRDSYIIVGQQYPALKTDDVYRDPQGHIIVDPVTGYPTKNPAQQIFGHGNPNNLLGITNNWSYKGFSLNVVWDYRSGNIIHNAVGNALDFTGTSWHSAQNGRQSFVIPNSVIQQADGSFVENTDVVIRNASRDFWVNSDYHNVGRTYVTSAAFWKLREVALTYQVPVKSVQWLQALSVSLVGRNLIMIRPVTNTYTDPEFNTTGGSNNSIGYTTEDQTPPTRIFGFSISATL
jgi:TonB-linked SusC/RagA family outer membrane protein